MRGANAAAWSTNTKRYRVSRAGEWFHVQHCIFLPLANNASNFAAVFAKEICPRVHHTIGQDARGAGRVRKRRDFVK
jgi:hypothetical protein